MGRNLHGVGESCGMEEVGERDRGRHGLLLVLPAHNLQPPKAFRTVSHCSRYNGTICSRRVFTPPTPGPPHEPGAPPLPPIICFFHFFKLTCNVRRRWAPKLVRPVTSGFEVELRGFDHCATRAGAYPEYITRNPPIARPGVTHACAPMPAWDGGGRREGRGPVGEVEQHSSRLWLPTATHPLTPEIRGVWNALAIRFGSSMPMHALPSSLRRGNSEESQPPFPHIARSATASPPTPLASKPANMPSSLPSSQVVITPPRHLTEY
jgi:hypothetical protein